jgi:predicted AAA+ superfamily ATPase
MAMSNHERIGRALDLLNTALRPYVERELQAVHGAAWEATVADARRSGRRGSARDEPPRWDTQALLKVLWDQWQLVFGNTLGRAERSLVSELVEVRNQWAHQQALSTDDTYRALDSIERLLKAIAAPEALEAERQKHALLRLRFEEQARREHRRASGVSLEGQPAGGLKPWREIVMPHPDVASGRYQQAEFAADLSQVHRGEATPEYQEPREFFRRTYLTEGLRHLLTGALRRLSGASADPVVQLQTNFGGGKTHSMLALYHLFAGIPVAELPGLEPVLAEVDGVTLPQKPPAVLVGTALSPAQPRTKPDGTVVHTLWGELAWQLLGAPGFARIAAADAAGVSPGSDLLRELLQAAAPCLVLIDEWVAYVRMLYGKDSLPGGSFDANLTFAQALCEAVRAVPRALLVASIPASDIEIGGEGGRRALERLQNVFSRMDSPWRPASAEEGFEIVRRRLFEPLTDPKLHTARDAVVRAFGGLYRSQPAAFPAECREGAYERRLTAAYPIHPEVFDRLYNDWSTLDTFQRTRGVLRLMAAVIHTLWERDDRSLMILPASVPIDASAVQAELTRYLEDSWVPVLESDVDGPHALPLTLDRDNPNLGRYSACRRVARTVYIGSAPTLRTANRGIDDRRITLGCAQPGESVATFSDALRRLSSQATYLYTDGQRSWYDTQPSVTRLARDRAAQLDRDAVLDEIKRRVRDEQRNRGTFARVHACPTASAEVPDERDTRLVILSPETPHSARTEDSPARLAAAQMLDMRGTSPRVYRNTLALLAADRTRLDELEQAIRDYLAWRSIEDERETLNLDAFQTKQTQTKRQDADETIRQRLPETYQWLLVPEQITPDAPLTWREIRLQGDGALAVRAARKLENEGLLLTEYAPSLLRLELDRVPLWRGDHVKVQQLAEDFAQYLYLPRLHSPALLIQAIEAGLRLLTWEQDTFAYADLYDVQQARYRGLCAGRGSTVRLDAAAVLIQPAVARRQLDAETPPVPALPTAPPDAEAAHEEASAPYVPSAPSRAALRPRPQPTAFYGTVPLDALRLGREAGRIGEEVLQHLAGLLHAEVEVTLEIRAKVPDGVPEHVVRTVTENCRTLRFTTQEFEEV